MVPRQHGCVVWGTGIVIKRLRGLAPPHASPSAAAGQHPNPPPLPHHYPPPNAPRPPSRTLGQLEAKARRQQQHGMACQPFAWEPELHHPPMPPLDALNALSEWMRA